MNSFVSLTSIAAPLPDTDIDTDVIFPARFLLLLDRRGLGRHLFHERRAQAAAGAPFVLSRAPFDKAQILVAGRNFGCGSSREQAVWALADFGIRCVIAPSFGEIFYGNCFRNGVLAVTLGEPEHRDVMTAAASGVAVDGRSRGADDPIVRGAGDRLPDRPSPPQSAAARARPDRRDSRPPMPPTSPHSRAASARRRRGCISIAASLRISTILEARTRHETQPEGGHRSLGIRRRAGPARHDRRGDQQQSRVRFRLCVGLLEHRVGARAARRRDRDLHPDARPRGDARRAPSTPA